MSRDTSLFEREDSEKKFNNDEVRHIVTTNLNPAFDQRIVCDVVVNYHVPVLYIDGKATSGDSEAYLKRIYRAGQGETKGFAITLIDPSSDH